MSWEDHYTTGDEMVLARILYKRARLIHLLVKDREALKSMNNVLMKENDELKAQMKARGEG